MGFPALSRDWWGGLGVFLVTLNVTVVVVALPDRPMELAKLLGVFDQGLTKRDWIAGDLSGAGNLQFLNPKMGYRFDAV